MFADLIICVCTCTNTCKLDFATWSQLAHVAVTLTLLDSAIGNLPTEVGFAKVRGLRAYQHLAPPWNRDTRPSLVFSSAPPLLAAVALHLV
jgi:hypothetical protein